MSETNTETSVVMVLSDVKALLLTIATLLVSIDSKTKEPK